MRKHVIGLTATAAALASLCTVLPASAATTRYASPTGTGTQCTQFSPCSLTEAVTGATDGDTVQLTADEYTLTAPLSISANGLTITGPTGMTTYGDFLAYILFSGIADSTSKIVLFGDNVHFQNLAIAGTVDGAAYLVGSGPGTGATYDRMIIRNDGTGDTLLGRGATVTNSEVLNTGSSPGGAAIDTSGTITGSTIYSAHGIAIRQSDSYLTSPHCTTVIRNTVAWGAAANLGYEDNPGGCTLSVDYDYSWIPNPGGGALGGGVVVSGTGAPVAGVHNLARTPAVFDPTDPGSTYLSDLQLPPGNPAIDAGCTAGCSDHDYYGRPRPIGVANDLGAMEQSLAPDTSALTISAITRTSAVLSAQLDPRGASATYSVQVRAAGSPGWTTVGEGTVSYPWRSVQVSATAEGLTAGTQYEARVTASNQRGAADIPMTTFRTSSAPPATLLVSGLKSKVTKSKARLVSSVTTSTSGTITQKATTGSKTRCTTTKNAGAAGTYPLTCTLTKKTRKELRSKALKLKVVTTLQPAGSDSVSVRTRIKVPRKR